MAYWTHLYKDPKAFGNTMITTPVEKRKDITATLLQYVKMLSALSTEAKKAPIQWLFDSTKIQPMYMLTNGFLLNQIIKIHPDLLPYFYKNYQSSFTISSKAQTPIEFILSTDALKDHPNLIRQISIKADLDSLELHDHWLDHPSLCHHILQHGITEDLYKNFKKITQKNFYPIIEAQVAAKIKPVASNLYGGLNLSFNFAQCVLLGYEPEIIYPKTENANINQQFLALHGLSYAQQTSHYSCHDCPCQSSQFYNNLLRFIIRRIIAHRLGKKSEKYPIVFKQPLLRYLKSLRK